MFKPTGEPVVLKAVKKSQLSLEKVKELETDDLKDEEEEEEEIVYAIVKVVSITERRPGIRAF